MKKRDDGWTRREALNVVGGLAAVAAAACSDDAGGLRDPGARSTNRDAAPVADSGLRADSGKSTDSGEALDTGDSPDAGGSPDAGDSPDSGAPIDSGPSNPDATVTCTVYPQQTEGPYYLDLNMVRRNVTEGKPGSPLTLIVEVLGENGCTPLRDVAVDIWHCDAGGLYSGYPGQLGGVDTRGQIFLRGTQLTGSDGRAQFDTIYPGWYPGRTTHIHFKVHLSGNREATSQMYFPEDVTAAVYRTGVYAARGQKDTSNTRDGVNQGRVPPLLALAQSGSGHMATLIVTVR